MEPSEEQQTEQKTEAEEEEEVEEEERPPMDLFKAIFASSSDEKSSSSSEDDSEEEEEVAPPTSELTKSSVGTLESPISDQVTPVPNISKVTGKICYSYMIKLNDLDIGMSVSLTFINLFVLFRFKASSECVVFRNGRSKHSVL